MRAAAQNTVEILLTRRKNASDFPGSAFLRKSIVETEASEVSAELTEDIAAASIATISSPFRTCGTAVNMKMGKMKSLALMPLPGRISGIEMASGNFW